MNNKNPGHHINIKRMIITLAIELSLYAVLVIAYFFIVLRFFDGILTSLFQSDLVTYAILGLGLIVAQGVLLEWVTSFILNRLKIDRVE